MDNVNNGEADFYNLYGWTKATGKELRYLQGVLLEQAKIDMKNEKRSNILLGMTAFFLTLFLKESIVVAVESVKIMDVQKILWCIVAIAVVLYLIYTCIQMLLNTLKRQTAKRFWNTVKNNEMNVTEVNIVENVTRVRAKHSFVMVCDLRNNKYKNQVRIIFSDKMIKKERGFLIDVPLVSGRNKLLVVPVNADSEKMQELAEKYYQKHMKQ